MATITPTEGTRNPLLDNRGPREQQRVEIIIAIILGLKRAWLCREDPNADSIVLAEVAIKYESPYAPDPPQNPSSSVITSVESPLKRRQSESHDDMRENDEKRRRLSDDLNWDKLIEDAQDAAMRGIEAAVPQNINGFSAQGPYQHHMMNDGAQHQVENGFAPYQQVQDSINAEKSVAISSGFTSDPHLMTRILSLPMLESLVSITCMGEAFLGYCIC
jgi:hypothetical protein